MLQISASSAIWFAPFVLPICVWVAWNDLRAMKIPNKAVYALVAVFAIIGLIALPFQDYLWRYLHVAVVLILGMVLNAAGAVGAGDAKFSAAAAPFLVIADLRTIVILLAANILAAFVTHRIARNSPLRKLAPNWESWDRGLDFPMGLALGGTLATYLIIGAFYGS